jgi:hypothetical protein
MSAISRAAALKKRQQLQISELQQQINGDRSTNPVDSSNTI